jgi:hypothetical protein
VLTLKADGGFVLDLKYRQRDNGGEKEREERKVGTWGVSGGTLELAYPDPPPMRYAATVEGGSRLILAPATAKATRHTYDRVKETGAKEAGASGAKP